MCDLQSSLSISQPLVALILPSYPYVFVTYIKNRVYCNVSIFNIQIDVESTFKYKIVFTLEIHKIQQAFWFSK